MKYKTLLLLFMLCCMACGQITGQPVKAFLGQWTMCKINKGNSSTVFNICPQITFAKNHTGVYKTAAEFTVFKYAADTTAHTVKFEGMQTDVFFSKHSVFTYAFKFNTNYTTLMLTTTDSVQYILRK